MTLRRTLIAVFGAFALTSCAPVEAPATEIQDLTITLTRGACFGACPTYTVSISGDGAVTYDGRANVAVRGRQTARIPAADVAQLAARFDEIGFWDLNDEYRSEATDLPTYTITIARGGRSKRVVDYAGVSAGMPRAVRDLEAEIDRVANTARWVLRDGQPVRELPPR